MYIYILLNYMLWHKYDRMYNSYMYVYTYIHTYVRTYVHTLHTLHTYIHYITLHYIHTYVYIYIHTYTKIYIHKYIYIVSVHIHKTANIRGTRKSRKLVMVLPSKLSSQGSPPPFLAFPNIYDILAGSGEWQNQAEVSCNLPLTKIASESWKLQTWLLSQHYH